MTDLEKRAMGRTPFTRDQLEDRYAMATMANPVDYCALCESHMRVLMELEELRKVIAHSKSLVQP